MIIDACRSMILYTDTIILFFLQPRAQTGSRNQLWLLQFGLVERLAV